MQDIVPGIAGEVRIAYWPKERPNDKVFSPWIQVSPNHDFTHQFQLTDLKANTTYQLESQCQSDSVFGQTIFGSFTTAPDMSSSASITFTVVTPLQLLRVRDSIEGMTQIMDIEFIR